MNHYYLKKTFAYIVLLCIVLMSYATAFGQSTDDLVQKCIGEIYHLQFDSARINAELIIRNDPGDPKGYFFDAMIVWWNININKENTSLDGEFFKKADKVIEVADKVLEKNGTVFVTADHGNAEQLVDYETGEPFTAHTTNPVPFILVNADPSYKLREGGCLADIAPTLIELMGMEQPKEMTGKSLLLK